MGFPLSSRRLAFIAALCLFVGLVAWYQGPRCGLVGRYETRDTDPPTLRLSRLDSRLNFTDAPLRCVFPDVRAYRVTWDGWLYLSESPAPGCVDFTHWKNFQVSWNETTVQLDGKPMGESSLDPGWHRVHIETINRGAGGRDALVFTVKRGDRYEEPHAWDLWPGDRPPSHVGLRNRVLLGRAGLALFAASLLFLLGWALSTILAKQMASRRGTWVAAAVLGAIALAVRGWALWNSAAMIESDEASTGLLALHIAQGVDFPAFLGGQAYQGSAEAFVIAALFKLFGVSAWTLKLWPLFCSVGFVVAAFLLFARMFPLSISFPAGLYLALPPQLLLEMSLKAWIGYDSTLFLGTLAVLWASRLRGRAQHPSTRSGQGAAQLLGLGALLGLCFWMHFVSLFLSLLCVLILLWDDPSLPKRFAFWAMVFGAVLGALPVWIYNLNHGWQSFAFLSGGQSGGGHPLGLLGNLTYVFPRQSLPALLGLHPRWRYEEPFNFLYGVPAPLFWGLFLLAGAGFAAQCVREARSPEGLRRPSPCLALAGFSALTLLLACRSSFGPVPHYLLALYLALPVALAVGFSFLSRVHPALPAAAMLLFIVQNVCGVAQTPSILAFQAQHQIYTGQLQTQDDGPLLAALEKEGLRYVSASYWTGQRLTFLSHENLIATYLWDRRYPPHFQALQHASRVGYLVHHNYFRDPGYHALEPLAGIEQADALFAYLGFAHLDASGYRVYYPPAGHPAADKNRWRLEGSGERAAEVADHDLFTAFVCSASESGWLSIDFGEERLLSGLAVAYPADATPEAGSVEVWGGASPDRLHRLGVLHDDPYLRAEVASWERQPLRVLRLSRHGTGPWRVHELFPD